MLQVYGPSVSFFINGLAKDYMATETVIVDHMISDKAGTFTLGKTATGK